MESGVSAIGGSPAKGKTSQLKILNGANNETFKGFYKWLKILNENCYKHFVKSCCLKSKCHQGIIDYAERLRRLFQGVASCKIVWIFLDIIFCKEKGLRELKRFSN
jgi:hypothetical protein